MDISQLLDPLNTEQRQAVSSEPTHMRVLAGAGSGKTRVLVHRIAWLIQIEQVAPFNLLAVTFTNKAAREMRQRILDMVGPSANAMWIGTFHSLGHRLLRLHWQEAQLEKQFQILDADDQLRMVKRIIRDLELDDNKFPPKQAQGFINRHKESRIRPQHLAHPQSDFEYVMQRVYKRYHTICEQSSLVDFTELLLRSYELWQTHPALREHYQKRFRHILIDEFQDTNTLQYLWIKAITRGDNNVMIVGDDDQSIYSWRGARVDNMYAFEKDFQPCQTIRLEQNYRSTNMILQAANDLIAQNANRLGKQLWTAQNEGEPIAIYEAFNETDEARFIVTQIQKLCQEQGHCLSECAILYRSNAQSRTLEETLIQSQIPYRIYGGLRFFERAEIKDALAYLRLLDNRHDDTAFERIVNKPARGIGQRTVAILRDKAQQYQQSLWWVARYMVQNKELTGRACSALDRFLLMIDRLDSNTRELSLHEQINELLNYTGLLAHYQNDKTEAGRAKAENLEELIGAARGFSRPAGVEGDTPMRTAFLTHAALESGETQADEHERCVQLMTVHAAKGLEFPIVFMAGMEEGLFPHKMAADSQDKLQEERRLCYVGMTRAMERLFMLYAESRYLYGKNNIQPSSRFLKELPESCCQSVRIKNEVSLPFQQQKASQQPSPAQTEPQSPLYQAGQQVSHDKFGEGIVLRVEGQGAKARLQINFENEGTKWLMAEYANLNVVRS